MYFLPNRQFYLFINYTHLFSIYYLEIRKRTNRTHLHPEPTSLFSSPITMDPASPPAHATAAGQGPPSRTDFPLLLVTPSAARDTAPSAAREAAPSAREAAPSAKAASSAKLGEELTRAANAVSFAMAAPVVALGEDVLAEVAVTRVASPDLPMTAMAGVAEAALARAASLDLPVITMDAAPSTGVAEVTLDSPASPALPVTTTDVISENVTTPMDAGSSPTTAALVRSLLPNISSPTVQYNLPILPVQR
jgi:hypothetical protein